MGKLIDLYDYADSEDIAVYWYSLRKGPSLSLPPSNFDNGAVALDPWKLNTIAEETVCLGHEVGHCKEGAFYNRFASCDLRKKHENRADKWAIEYLVPVDQLDKAIAEGHTELWDLADYFGLTEEFMRKVVCWYTYGNLATEMYF